MLIRKQPPRAGLDEPIRHDGHKRPVTRRDFSPRASGRGSRQWPAHRVQPVCQPAGGARGAVVGHRGPEDELRHRRAGRRQDPVHLHRSRGRRQHGRLQRADRRTRRPARFPEHRGLRQAGPAGRHAAEHDQRDHGTSFTDPRLGLAFHSDSAFLRGILDRVRAGTAASINGAVIAARSENDTGNNPHNPMYGIHPAGADGALATLIGSRARTPAATRWRPPG